MIGKQMPQKQAKEAPVKSIDSSLFLKRRALIAASWLALLTASQPALAQEAEPGDTCAGLTAGTVRQSSGPEISGGHVLYCDGANWVSVLSYDTDAHLTTLGAQDCNTGEVLSYNGTYWACTAAISLSGIWQQGAGSVIYYNSGTPQVGIGLTDPSSTLEVNGDIRVTSKRGGSDLVISGSAAGEPDYILKYGATNSLGIRSNGVAHMIQGAQFMTGGEISIGTTGATMGMRRGSGPHLFLGSDGGAQGMFDLDTKGVVNTSALFKVSENGTAAFTVNHAGMVAIGAIAPDVALDVNGDIDYTGVIRDMSDARFKSDIQRLSPDVAAAVGNLAPVSFTMNDGDGSRELGFIAQDVEKVLPELVRTSADGMKSLNYVGMIAPLTTAVQELQKENDDLRRRLERLEEAAQHSVND